MNSNCFTEIEWASLRLPTGGEISLRALRVGKGLPRTVVVIGLHGDETAPLYVLEQMLRTCQIERITGTTDFVLTVNWLGLLSNRREFPIMHENVNRLFTNGGNETPARVLVNKLESFLRDSDLVIDLHNWDSPTTILGIHYDCGSTTVNDRSIGVLAAFRCAYIWTPENNSDFIGTLGQRLASIPIAYAGIEFPPPWLIDHAIIEDLSRRLFRVLSRTPASEPRPPTGLRREIVSPDSGLLLPLKNPGDIVSANEPIADLRSVSSLKTLGRVLSPQAGMLLCLASRRFVHSGETLGFVGIGTLES